MGLSLYQNEGHYVELQHIAQNCIREQNIHEHNMRGMALAISTALKIVLLVWSTAGDIMYTCDTLDDAFPVINKCHEGNRYTAVKIQGSFLLSSYKCDWGFVHTNVRNTPLETRSIHPGLQ